MKRIVIIPILIFFAVLYYSEEILQSAGGFWFATCIMLTAVPTMLILSSNKKW